MASLRELYLTIGLRDTALSKIVEINKTVDKTASKFRQASKRVTEFADKYKWAIRAISMATMGMITMMTRGAMEEEKYRANIKSLVELADIHGKGAKRLNEEFQRFIDQAQELDYTSKRVRAAMISQLMLYGATEDTIRKLVPVMERYGIATGRTSEQVLYAIQSAAGGIYRSLKYLGITLGEEDVKKKMREMAREMGATWEKMSEEQRRFAAIAELVIPRMNEQIGDFADATDSAWARTQKFKYMLDDLTGDVGAMFLPILNKVTSTLLRVSKSLENIPFAKTAIAIGLVTTATLALAGVIIGPLNTSLNLLSSTLGRLGISFGPLALAIAGITAAFYLLKKAYEANFLGFRDRLQELWRVAKAIFGALKVIFSAFWETVKDTFTPIVDLLKEFGLIGDEAGKSFRGAFQPVIDFIKAHQETFRTLGKILGWLATGPIRVLILAVYLLIKALEKLMRIASEVKAKIEPVMKIGSYLMPGIGGVKLVREVAAGGLVPSPRELVASTTTVIRTTPVNKRKIEIKPGAVVIRGVSDPEKAADLAIKKIQRLLAYS